MENILSPQFTVYSDYGTVTVVKSCDATAQEVWDAWTQSELLDQWWAPKPWKSRTKSMYFTEGGLRIYAMVGPEGQEHWALSRFSDIQPNIHFLMHDAFCDSEGNISTDFPRSVWDVNFSATNEYTQITIEIKHEKPADLETIMAMGFREGFTQALENLDELLEKRTSDQK